MLLLLLSAILVYKTIAAQAPPPADDDVPVSMQGPTPTGAGPASTQSNSPPPSGGGLQPTDDPPQTGNGGQEGQDGQEGQEGHSPPPSPGTGQGSVDPSEGTLSFLFSPDSGNTLDSQTASLIGVFLSLPGNAQNSAIVVEMPQLSDEDAETLMSAIISAFAAQGVREQRITFTTRASSDSADGVYEVTVYFAAYSGK